MFFPPHETVRPRRLKAPVPGLRLLAIAAALLGGGPGPVPALKAGQSVLIPSEDNRWDGPIRKAVQQIHSGDLPSGIQTLQEVVDSAHSRRSLKAVPDGFESRPLESIRLAAEGRPAPPAVLPDGGPPDQAARPQAGKREVFRGPGELLLDPDFSAPGSSTGSFPGVRRYLSVAEVARQLLSDLPLPGIAEYRKLYGDLAEGLYRSALEREDLDLLSRVAEDYFLTEAGEAARDRLAEAWFESGRFNAALSLWKSAGGPPEGSRERPAGGAGCSLESRLKALQALRLLGRVREYERARGQFLDALGADPAGSPAGEAKPGGDEVGGLEARLRAFEGSQPFPADASTVAPGIPQGPPPPLPGRTLGFDWNSRFPLSRGVSQIGPAGRTPFERRNTFSPMREPVRAYPFHPAFERGGEEDLLYLGAVFSLQSVSVATGKIVKEYRRHSIPETVVNFQEGSESPVYTVSLAEGPPGGESPAGGPDAGTGQGSGQGSVQSTLISGYLGSMVKFKHYMGYEITADIPHRCLAAVDRASGQVLWRTGNLAVGREGKTVSFTTPVLVKGGRVIGGGWQQHGYIDGILVALDLSSGGLLWHQLVASSQMEGTMFGELAREPFAAAVAEREGIIYYPTNLGAVAALDAATGRILWLTTYDVIEVTPADGRRSPFRKIVWGVNPPLLLGDVLIVTPRDSMYLYGIDCSLPLRGRRNGDPNGDDGPLSGGGAGRVLFRYANFDGEIRDLLGYAGGRLYFTGPGGVQALDVSGCPGMTGVPPSGSPREGAGPAQLAARLLSPIKRSEEGRGALTGSGVVVVARRASQGAGAAPRGAEQGGENRLWLVDLALKTCHDLTGPLPPDEHGTHGGNVTVTPEKVILTSRDLVAAFSARPQEPEARAPGAAPAGDGAPPASRREPAEGEEER